MSPQTWLPVAPLRRSRVADMYTPHASGGHPKWLALQSPRADELVQSSLALPDFSEQDFGQRFAIVTYIRVTVENYLVGVNTRPLQKTFTRTMMKAFPACGEHAVNLIGQASVAFFCWAHSMLVGV